MKLSYIPEYTTPVYWEPKSLFHNCLLHGALINTYTVSYRKLCIQQVIIIVAFKFLTSASFWQNYFFLNMSQKSPSAPNSPPPLLSLKVTGFEENLTMNHRPIIKCEFERHLLPPSNEAYSQKNAFPLSPVWPEEGIQNFYAKFHAVISPPALVKFFVLRRFRR